MMVNRTNRTRYLFHVTRKENWFPIGVLGLLQEFSAGRRQGVFLVTESMLPWAIDHVAARNACAPDDLIVVAVRVRRFALTPLRFRTVRRGLWRHNGDIPPCRIEWVDTYPRKTPAAELPAGVLPNQESAQ